MLSIIFLSTSCTKKENATQNPNALIGEWILVSEISDDSILPFETETFTCSSEECHRLIFTDNSYAFIESHEDFSTTYGGQYLIDGNKILCLTGNQGLFTYENIQFTIEEDRILNEWRLFIRYSEESPAHSVSQSYVREGGF